ncbi:MAG: hypothetical protein MHM6MM_001397 [Cercozoa sp. M6MM]
MQTDRAQYATKWLKTELQMLAAEQCGHTDVEVQLPFAQAVRAAMLMQGLPTNETTLSAETQKYWPLFAQLLHYFRQDQAKREATLACSQQPQMIQARRHGYQYVQQQLWLQQQQQQQQTQDQTQQKKRSQHQVRADAETTENEPKRRRVVRRKVKQTQQKQPQQQEPAVGQVTVVQVATQDSVRADAAEDDKNLLPLGSVDLWSDYVVTHSSNELFTQSVTAKTGVPVPRFHGSKRRRWREKALSALADSGQADWAQDDVYAECGVRVDVMAAWQQLLAIRHVRSPEDARVEEGIKAVRSLLESQPDDIGVAPPKQVKLVDFENAELPFLRSAAMMFELRKFVATNLRGFNEDLSAPKLARFARRLCKRLPGPQPGVLARDNLEVLRSHMYYVTEKSDGLRFVLMKADFGWALISRRFDFFTFNVEDGGYKYGIPDTTPDGCSALTLLDGELLRHPEKRHLHTFLVYDAAVVLDRHVHQLPLFERLEHVKPLVEQFERAFNSGANVDGFPFLLKLKQMWPAPRVEECLRRIKQVPNAHWKYRDASRSNGNDGLVFTRANAPYVERMTKASAPALVKYKPASLQTVDVRVVAPFLRTNDDDTFSVDLWVTGPNEQEVRLTTAVVPGTHFLHNGPVVWTARLYRGQSGRATVANCAAALPRTRAYLLFVVVCLLMLNASARTDESVESKESADPHLDLHSVIVEVCFDGSHWRPLLARTDKKMPNFVAVATDTLMVAAQNLAVDEVVRAAKMGLTQWSVKERSRCAGAEVADHPDDIAARAVPV